MHPPTGGRKGWHIVAGMPDFRRTIAPDPRQVAGVTSAFAEFAEAHQVPPAVRRSVSVALDELLSNIVAYGFSGVAGGEVTVQVDVRPDRLVVTLGDNGNPFNPLTMAPPDTTRPLAEREIGGLGIHLTRQMMDEVGYQRRGDRNVVTLNKLLLSKDEPKGQAMDIRTRSQNGVTVLAFAGSLDSNTSPAAQQAVDETLKTGAKKLVVDCTALDYISSAGLRVLLGAAKRLGGGSGGGLRLFGLNETVREVFEISGFSTILAVFGTEAEALRGF